MDSIREQNAQMAGHEFRQALQGLMTQMINRDKIRYIAIANEDIIGFTSQGPYYSSLQDGWDISDIDIMQGEEYNESLSASVENAMDTMEERADPDRESSEREAADEDAIASALMVESPLEQNLSFFYISDLVDVILERIEAELDRLPDELDPQVSTATRDENGMPSGRSTLGGMSAGSVGGSLDQCERRMKADEIRKSARAFKKLRVALGPVEIVPVRESMETVFVNFGDLPISVKYFVEWMTMKFFSKSEYVYTLSKFLMDLMNNLVDQFLNSDKCFGYPVRQNITMNQAVITSHAETQVRMGSPDEVMDSLTWTAIQQGTRRLDLRDPDTPYPVLRTAGYDALSPRDEIPLQQEVNYFVFFAGRTMPTEMMNGDKRQDEERGIFHYMLGRDKGLVYDISLSKAQTPGLAEVRFEQEGYDGLQQMRVVYDANIKTFANVNTYPGSYIYIEPYGFSPSAQNEIDLTQFGIGGYYMIIRSKHKFAQGVAKTDMECKWVNQIDAEGRSAAMDRSAAEAKTTHGCAAARTEGGLYSAPPVEEEPAPPEDPWHGMDHIRMPWSDDS